MQKNAAQLIIDLSDICSNRELPDITEAKVHLGTYGSIVPLSYLKEKFSSLKVSYVSTDKTYAIVQCKTHTLSFLTVEARVSTAELTLKISANESFEIPTAEEEAARAAELEQLPQIEIIRDSSELEPLPQSESLPSQDEAELEAGEPITVPTENPQEKDSVE